MKEAAMSLTRGIVAFLGAAFVVVPVRGQELERDYSKYLRPLVFVLPEAPEANASSPSRTYVAKVTITAGGTVQLPVEVEPNEAAMVSAVNDVAKLWVFAPGLDKDCKPGPRSGRVMFEYDTGAGRAWVELPPVESATLRRQKVTVVPGKDLPPYPRFEMQRGISSGTVTVAMKLMADGSTAEHNVYFAVPRTKGFMETALKASREVAVTFSEPPDKPFYCALMNYRFKLE
jgi:hypothetical protein